MTKIYKTWLQRFEDGEITYGQMLQFVAVVGGWWYDDRPRGRPSALTLDEAHDLMVRLREMPDGLALDDRFPGKWYDSDLRRYLTWTEYGRQWAKRNGRRAGVPPEMIAAADRLEFRFVDVTMADAGPGFVPVYRATDPETGQSWKYAAPAAWQARFC